MATGPFQKSTNEDEIVVYISTLNPGALRFAYYNPHEIKSKGGGVVSKTIKNDAPYQHLKKPLPTDKPLELEAVPLAAGEMAKVKTHEGLEYHSQVTGVKFVLKHNQQQQITQINMPKQMVPEGIKPDDFTYRKEVATVEAILMGYKNSDDNHAIQIGGTNTALIALAYVTAKYFNSDGHREIRVSAELDQKTLQEAQKKLDAILKNNIHLDLTKIEVDEGAHRYSFGPKSS